MLEGSAGFFWRGLVIGFSIAAPVGPIGVLCIRHSLASGRLAGFSAGMGAASADTLYALVGALGLTALSGFLVGQQFWLRLVGGLFLCWLALRILLHRPPPPVAVGEDRVHGHGENTGKPRPRLLNVYLSTFGLTLSNPLTILSFAAVFAGLGLGGAGESTPAAALLVLGVFCGSAAWWLLLSSAAGALRSRLTPHLLRRVDLFSGAVILIFGAAILLSIVNW